MYHVSSRDGREFKEHRLAMTADHLYYEPAFDLVWLLVDCEVTAVNWGISIPRVEKTRFEGGQESLTQISRRVETVADVHTLLYS